MAGDRNECGMVDAPVSTEEIRRYYDRASRFYFIVAAVEKKARQRGLALAAIKPGDKVLEVAVGIGRTFLEILKLVEVGNTVYGVDISEVMLRKTSELAASRGCGNFELTAADARELPFDEGTFDVVYSSYTLDLIPTGEIPVVLGEFRRVLKRGGRLVLVDMSKRGASPVLYERLYRLMPRRLGGCRPVLMGPFLEEAGFTEIQRRVQGRVLPTEIVTCRK